MRLTRAAQAGRWGEVEALNAAFEPLWTLFKTHGSLRIMYAVADGLSLSVGNPPLPLMRVDREVVAVITTALGCLEV